MQVLIIGGGSVGLTLAHLLVRQGIEVGLSERYLPESYSHSEFIDLRVSALSPVVLQLFKKINCWDAIQQHSSHYGEFDQIHVWENNNYLEFDGKKIAQQPLGIIIENNLIRQVLWSAVQDKITLLQPGSEDEKKAKNSVELVIAADGANSKTREAAGINIQRKAYSQTALVAMIETAKPHDNIARQCFLSTGPLAFLPLAHPKQCSIVWSMQSEQIQPLLSNTPDEFNNLLQKSFGETLGEVTLISERLSFDLKMQQAERYVKDSFALVGDSAHTIHPLAGFGLNLGIFDAMSLAHYVGLAKKQQRRLGGLSVLKKYERERKTENNFMLQVVDSFTQPVMRKIGLNIARHSELLQQFFMAWMSHHGRSLVWE